jgi:hypothetical protein
VVSVNFASLGTDLAIVYPEDLIFPVTPSVTTTYPLVGVAEKVGIGIQELQDEPVYCLVHLQPEFLLPSVNS